ncbi:MAG: alpha/beta hydrolase [Candidatus Thorarchaeota archaeon]
MFQELLILMLLLAFILLIWSAYSFRSWKRQLLTGLGKESSIALTPQGPVEYVLRGEGPVILVIHGAPGGYDQGLLASEMWTEERFSTLAISRPGYLGTPLSVGEVFDKQADAIAGLLDSLSISRVAILGASAGGPVALNFALQYPEKLWALIIVAGVSQPYEVREDQKSSILGRIMLSDLFMDVGIWFFDVLTRRWPSLSLKEMLKENVTLDSEKRKDYAESILANPGQVDWYKRFIKTTIPLSPRKYGLGNDLDQLSRVSMQGLERIQCPTLVIHGTADGDVPFTDGKYIAESIPNARMYSLDDVGHIVWLGEHAEEMNQDILKFLRENIVAE